LSTKAVIGKTPIESWSNKKPDISYLRIFGCDAYVLIPEEKRTKFDDKSIKGLFLGYDDESKAYRVVDTRTMKLYISRNVKFNELSICSNVLLPIDSKNVDDDIELDYSSDSDKEDITIKTDVVNETPRPPLIKRRVTDCVAEYNYKQKNEIYTPEDSLRRSKQITQPPREYWRNAMGVYALNTSNISEPTCFNEANKHEEWRKAMQEEYDSLIENKTWTIDKLPPGRKAIGCRWTYKVKERSDGSFERFKARLVA